MNHRRSCRGTTLFMGVNLTSNGRLKPQLHRQNPFGFASPLGRANPPSPKGRRCANRAGLTAYAGFKTLNFPLVRVGGLCLCSREFYSSGLKLTPMSNAVPLPDGVCNREALYLYSLECFPQPVLTLH